MKKIIYSTLMGSLCLMTSAFAQSNKNKDKDTVTLELPCTSTKQIFESLDKDFNETPILLAQANTKDVIILFWANKGTQDKSWTLLITSNEATCIVAVGKEYKLKNK